MESSPSRRRACSRFYEFLDSVKQCRVEGKDFEICARGLTLYRLPEWTQVCRVGVDSGEIEWDHRELERMGLAAMECAVIELEDEGAATPVPLAQSCAPNGSTGRGRGKGGGRPPGLQPQTVQPEEQPPAKRSREEGAAEGGAEAMVEDAPVDGVEGDAAEGDL